MTPTSWITRIEISCLPGGEDGPADFGATIHRLNRWRFGLYAGRTYSDSRHYTSMSPRRTRRLLRAMAALIEATQ